MKINSYILPLLCISIVSFIKTSEYSKVQEIPVNIENKTGSILAFSIKIAEKKPQFRIIKPQETYSVVIPKGEKIESILFTQPSEKIQQIDKISAWYKKYPIFALPINPKSSFKKVNISLVRENNTIVPKTNLISLGNISKNDIQPLSVYEKEETYIKNSYKK